jgi:hypothetical protein
MGRKKKKICLVRDAIPRPERRTLEFVLVSYQPHPLRHESANIAVVLFGDGFADVRIAPDWQRVTAIDPRADVKFLRAVASEIRDRLQAADKREEMLRTMEDSWSDAIQVSARKGIVTADPATEMETLASQYL